VVITPALYTWVPRFIFQSGDWLFWLRLFVVFHSSPTKCWDSALKLGHDHFLPNPFQFIIHLSPLHLVLYSLSYWNSTFRTTNKEINQHQIFLSLYSCLCQIWRLLNWCSVPNNSL
jgi:hypothetical protein